MHEGTGTNGRGVISGAEAAIELTRKWEQTKQPSPAKAPVDFSNWPPAVIRESDPNSWDL